MPACGAAKPPRAGAKPPCGCACAAEATTSSAAGTARRSLSVLDTCASATGDDLHALACGKVLPAALHYGDGLPVIQAHDDFLAVLRRTVVLNRVAGEAAADGAEDRRGAAAGTMADSAAEQAADSRARESSDRRLVAIDVDRPHADDASILHSLDAARFARAVILRTKRRAGGGERDGGSEQCCNDHAFHESLPFVVSGLFDGQAHSTPSGTPP